MLITFQNKVTGQPAPIGFLSAAEANEIKEVVNFNAAAIRLVTPEQYREEGDTDLEAAQKAVDSGHPVLLEKNYEFNGSLILTNNRFVVGYGPLSKITTTANAPVFSIQGSNNIIRLVSVEGNYTGSNQHAVSIVGESDLSDSFVNNIVELLDARELGGGLIYGHYVADGEQRGNKFINCNAYHCVDGYLMDERFEYSLISGCTAQKCIRGGRVSGGNNTFINCDLSYNHYGLYCEAGQNNGHGSFVGGKINHCLYANVITSGVTIGFQFEGVQIFAGQGGVYGRIELGNSDQISFNGCQISVEEFDFGSTASINTKVQNCTFYTIPTYQNYVAGNVWWGGNLYNGSRPSEDTIPEYTDNASAISAGMKINMQYRTGDAIKTVH